MLRVKRTRPAASCKADFREQGPRLTSQQAHNYDELQLGTKRLQHRTD